MNTYKIAVVPGDGIGPEVVTCAIEVMITAAKLDGGFQFAFQSAPMGASCYLETGNDLPAESLETCRRADAILLGACGLPEVRKLDGTELTPQISLRRELDLYAGIRPARRYAGVATPLAGDPAIDMVVVRESTEGLFASLGGGIVLGDQVSTDTQVITRRGTERVVRAAFRLARQSNHREPRVTCVDKANVLRSFAFFRKVFDEVAAEFPEVAADHLYVDAAAMEMVRRPSRFHVIVAENLLGDILSDLAAGLVGGLGMAPSGDIGDRHAVFQPCHGTAPDLIGRGIANPVAAILSGQMLLAYLSTKHNDQAAGSAARRIESAVSSALESATARTPDIGGTATTTEATRDILNVLARQDPRV